jgi:hypothetical protein
VALEQVIYLMRAATVKGIELLATYDVIDNREKDSSYLLLYHILSLILN